MDLSNISIYFPISLAVIFIGLFFILKKGNVKISKNGIEAINNTNQTKIVEPLIPRQYAKDMFQLVDRNGEHKDKVNELRDKLLESQMRYYEEMELAAIAEFKTNFKKTIKPYIIQYNSSEDVRGEVKAYYQLLNLLFKNIKDIFRKWFRSNHYYELTEDEWNNYVNIKKQTLKTIILEFFEEEWISKIISIEEIKKLNPDTEENLENIINRTLNQARHLSIKYYEELQEEKANWSAYVMRIAGYDPYNFPSIIDIQSDK